MALVDLTNFNPYKGESERSWRRHNANMQAMQNAFNALNQGLQRSADRRAALEAQNQQFRDREYSLINTATDQLVQPQTNSKVTDLQLQQIGQQMKQEYYDAVKTYQNSDKGDEARQAFEQAKQKALSSARTVSGALDNLTAQTTSFEKLWNSGGVSDAMNPAVREFMIDLVDPNTPKDQFQIVTDPETGQLKYQGQTTSGHPVDFFLDDVANGDNAFAAIPKVDMPKVVQDLTKGLKADMIQEKREDGSIIGKTNWGSLGEQLHSRMDVLLQDESQFRAIAAGEGFGWDAFNAVKNGEVWVDPVDGKEYASFDDIKAELKQDILDKIETVMPHQEEVLFDPNAQPTLVQQAQTSEAIKKQHDITSSVIGAAQKKDIDYFKHNLVGRDGIDNVVIKDGKLVVGKGFGKKFTPTGAYDLSNQADLFRLTELFGGNRDMAQLESNIINF